MDCKSLVFSGHAIRRMFERGIRETDVRQVMLHGEVLARYEDDTPFPSLLILGFVAGKPLHVVLATDEREAVCHVVTAYVPDQRMWHPDYRTRREA